MIGFPVETIANAAHDWISDDFFLGGFKTHDIGRLRMSLQFKIQLIGTGRLPSWHFVKCFHPWMRRQWPGERLNTNQSSKMASEKQCLKIS